MSCFAVILQNQSAALSVFPFYPHSRNLFNVFVLDIISASLLCKGWSLIKFSILIDLVLGVNFFCYGAWQDSVQLQYFWSSLSD